MVEEIELLERMVRGVTEDAFLADKPLQRACERCLEILGEAAKAMPPGTRLRSAGIPWSDMARMRDVLIHAYHRVDPRIVWVTVTKNAVPLLPKLQEALAAARSSS